MKIINSNIIYYLIYLLPVAIILGPFLTNFFVFLCCFFFLISVILEKQFNYYKSIFVYSFILIYFYIIFLSFLSEKPLLSLESSLPFIRFLFLAFILKEIIKNKNDFNKIGLIYIFTFIFVLIDAFIQLSFGKDILGFANRNSQITGIFHEEQILGSYVSRMLPLVIGFILITNNSIINNKYTLMLLILTSLVIILLSGERAAFMNFITFLFLFFIFNIIKINKLFYAFIPILLIVIISVVLLNSDTNDRFIKKTFLQLKEMKNYPNYPIIYSDHHLLHYLTAYNIIKDNPIIGIGPKMYREYCKKEKYMKTGDQYFAYPEIDWHNPEKDIDSLNEYYRVTSLDGCSTHPHHFHVQILTETGFLGYILFIIAIIFIIIKVFHYKSSFYFSFNKCMLIAILINYSPFVPSGNIFGSYLSTICFLPIIFLFATK